MTRGPDAELCSNEVGEFVKEEVGPGFDDRDDLLLLVFGVAGIAAAVVERRFVANLFAVLLIVPANARLAGIKQRCDVRRLQPLFKVKNDGASLTPRERFPARHRPYGR